MKGFLLAIHHEIVPAHLLCMPIRSHPNLYSPPRLHLLALYRRVAPKIPDSKATVPQTTGANDHCGTTAAPPDVLPDVEVDVTCPLPAVAVPVD